MSTSTLNGTSNGHTDQTELSSEWFPESRQAHWPDDKPLPEDADSHLLIIRVDGLPEFQPDSPYSSALPYRLPPMTREAAEMMAAKLNRDIIEEAQNRRVWWVVVYLCKKPHGFACVRVPVPRYKIWRPESEYDLPPGIVGPEINCNIRKNRTDFNRQQLHRRDEWGVKLIEWALHVKPIRKPGTSLQNSANLAASANLPKARPIPPAGHHIIQTIKDNLRFCDVTSNHLGETVVNHPIVRIDPALRDEPVENYIGKHASQIRGYAAKLLDIANQLDGNTEVPLTPVKPVARELFVDGCEEVSMLIYNAEDDQDAIAKAREALAILNH